MGSIENISELCRLCLISDQVNVPIFDENPTKEQTFVKINSCLPVKVSRDDSLPKKICDGCSYKLDMCYTFRNASVEAEKQLLELLNQAGLSACTDLMSSDPLASTKAEIMVKQETFEPIDARGDGDTSDMGLDSHNYMMQQQKLAYPQDFDYAEASGSATDVMTDEPAPKRAKRAAALNKAPVETDDDDLDAVMDISKVTKAEDEDSEDVDQPEYAEVPSTSADEQPGPSGVGKAAAEAPCSGIIIEEIPNGNAKNPCNKCDLDFTSRKLLLQHKRLAHYKQLVCEFCSEIFSEKVPLLFHSKIHIQDGFYPCSECGEKFDAYFGLVYHKKIHGKITCNICGDKFEGPSFRDLYRKHSRVHLTSCDICKKHISLAYIKRHKKTVHKEKVQLYCLECGKPFNSKFGLKRHIFEKHDGEQYICEFCGKLFGSLSGFKLHLHLHSGEKSYICHVCGKRFSHNNLLKLHVRVHTRERPHVCKFCKRSYSQRSSLAVHLKVAHSQERPFECSICQKRFAVKSLLNTHLKQHSNKCV